VRGAFKRKIERLLDGMELRAPLNNDTAEELVGIIGIRRRAVDSRAGEELRVRAVVDAPSGSSKCR